MASTAIPAIKAALLALLKEAEGLQGITVTAGKEPERDTEYVWITNAKAARDWKLLKPAPTPLDEDVRVTLWVVALMGGADHTESEERAFEIAGEVETAIRQPAELSPIDFGHMIEKLEDSPLLRDSRWGCQIEITVLVKGRI
jgi:hypothetical protein